MFEIRLIESTYPSTSDEFKRQHDTTGWRLFRIERHAFFPNYLRYWFERTRT